MRHEVSWNDSANIQTARAEGMNIPPLAVHAVPNGEKAVEALVI
jgi:hypothetical protein